jgi:hypothetical protein
MHSDTIERGSCTKSMNVGGYSPRKAHEVVACSLMRPPWPMNENEQKTGGEDETGEMRIGHFMHVLRGGSVCLLSVVRV